MDNNIIDNNEMRGINPVPNATAVLVLGILSIVFCFCYGIVGLVLGIIALALASKSIKAYNESPSFYSLASFKNMRAGRVCAIIGTCLSGLYILFIIIALVFIGNAAMLGPMFSGMK